MAVFNKSLPVAIGSDHAGFAYKTELIAWLEQKGFQVKDFGTYSTDSVDYPDFAHPTAASVEKGEAAFGILHPPGAFVGGYFVRTEDCTTVQTVAATPDLVQPFLVSRIHDFRFAMTVRTYHVNILS